MQKTVMAQEEDGDLEDDLQDNTIEFDDKSEIGQYINGVIELGPTSIKVEKY